MIAFKAKHTQTSYFGQKPQIFFRKGVPNCNFDLIKDFFFWEFRLITPLRHHKQKSGSCIHYNTICSFTPVYTKNRIKREVKKLTTNTNEPKLNVRCANRDFFL